MKGYQVTFCTAEGRRHGHQPMAHWLMDTIRSLGITGATLTAGIEGVGRDGRLHSAHFFELADQPVEVMVAVTQAQCDQLFATLEREGADVFYVKTPVEFGVVGQPKA
jgi:PII-like signaling protein